MYDQNGDALLNDATKMISFTMLYHCINASTNYTSKKKVILFLFNLCKIMNLSEIERSSESHFILN